MTDLSSNGTWISFKTSDCAVKLEKGKSTLLEDGDVILLTKSTALNLVAISIRYHSSPFPRNRKFTHKTGQPLEHSKPTTHDR